MAGGENPGPGQPETNWVQCLLVDDLGVFRATEGSTEGFHLLYGVETVLRPTVANKGGKWYRGVVEAADCLVARWHRDEAERSWLRHAAEDAKSDGRGKGWGGASVLIPLSTNAETTCGTVAERFDYVVEPELLQPPGPGGFVRFLLIC